MEIQEGSDFGPLLECDLVFHSSRLNDLNDLGVFDFDCEKPTPADQFDRERRQLLTDGHFLGSELESRLQLVKFGKHTGGNPRALLVLPRCSLKAACSLSQNNTVMSEPKFGDVLYISL